MKRPEGMYGSKEHLGRTEERIQENLPANRNAEPSGIEDAIDRAIDKMPKDFEIKKFITANRVAVKNMCLTEYNEAEKAMDLLKIPQNQRTALSADLSRKA